MRVAMSWSLTSGPRSGGISKGNGFGIVFCNSGLYVSFVRNGSMANEMKFLLFEFASIVRQCCNGTVPFLWDGSFTSADLLCFKGQLGMDLSSHKMGSGSTRH